MAQLARIIPYFALAHGVRRVDDRKVSGGIIQVIRNGLRWRDAPEVYGLDMAEGPWSRWSRVSSMTVV
jgi:putative transposase